MRRFLARVATGLHIAVFAVVCVGALPVLLIMFGVNAVRDWMDRWWPDSHRARAVRFWFGLLVPFVMIVVMLILLVIMALRLRALHEARGLE